MWVVGGGVTKATPLAEKTARRRGASDGAEVSVGTRAVPQGGRPAGSRVVV